MRTNKSLGPLLLTLAASTPVGAGAVVTFNVDPTSTLDIEVVLDVPFLGIRTGEATSSLSGTFTMDVETDASSARFLSGDISGSDVSISIDIVVGTVEASLTGARFDLESGPLPIGPGTEIDVGGTVLVIDGGAFDAMGPFDINESIDFAAEPLSFDVPSPTIGTIEVGDLSPDSLDVTLSVPVALSQVVDLGPDVPVGVTVNVTGRIDGTAVSVVLPGGMQRPGDASQDGQLDVADAVRLLFHLFSDSPPPLPCTGNSPSEGGNLGLLDLNDDRSVDVSDVLYLLAFLFRSGPPPAQGTECVLLSGCPERCP